MMPDDLTDILQIALDCGLSHWSRKDYLDEAERNDSIMICAECEDSEVAGFLVSRKVPGSKPDGRLDAELYNIGVWPKLQNTGCGTLLLQYFLGKCRAAAVDNVWLDVRNSNNNAIDFYKRFGFHEFTRRKGFYGDPPEDGIVMKLSL